MTQGYGLGGFDRKKLRNSARAGRRGQGSGRDFAVEGTDGKISVQRGILRKLFDFFGPELSYGDLIGRHA